MVHVNLGFFGGQQLTEGNHHQQTQVPAGKHCIHNEQVVVLDVAVRDTIIDPSAMVVHFIDTAFALLAVVSPCCFPCIFTRTQFFVA